MWFIGRNEITLVCAQERRHVNVGQPAIQNPDVNQDKGHVEPRAQNEAGNDPVPQNVPEPQPGPANPRPVERRDAIAADVSDQLTRLSHQDRGEGSQLKNVVWKTYAWSPVLLFEMRFYKQSYSHGRYFKPSRVTSF